MKFRSQLIALLIALVFLSLVLAGCASSPALPSYGQVPHFNLTDSTGKAFDSQSLQGRVWIVDFIFTNCPGPCPRMTSQMHKIERQVNSFEDVRLLSISVDPDRDTPPVLDAYARRFGGPTPQWYFLTGTPDTIHLLAKETFKIGDLISVMDHSTKFMLVDKKGAIRGYYSTFDTDGIPSLLSDLNALRKENS